jgi:hypothetical protein
LEALISAASPPARAGDVKIPPSDTHIQIVKAAIVASFAMLFIWYSFGE